MCFQLGAIAQLRMDVPLPADKDKEGRLDRFILAMTVCGDIWTVEYAYRARVEDPTVSLCPSSFNSSMIQLG
jgi:ethanolamine utilization microcompartment shell protein EutS